MGTGLNASFEKGQFYYPRNVYYDVTEEMIYIGDWYSVQLFKRDQTVENLSYTCLQRIGDRTSGTGMNEFNCVNGVCIYEDHLYVCDAGNVRVQVFRRKDFI